MRRQKFHSTVTLHRELATVLVSQLPETFPQRRQQTSAEALSHLYQSMHDLVFVNYRTGEPIKNSSYDTHLYKLCEKAGIAPFGMHALRHTYATRAIERGMQPKVLQQLLGHASIKTTMDKYVHVSDDSMQNAVRLFEAADSEKKG